jgi:hypothetical protein
VFWRLEKQRFLQRFNSNAHRHAHDCASWLS